MFALEFHTAWVEDTLFLGTFPQAVAEGTLDCVFGAYGGKTDPPTPDWKATLMRYYSHPGIHRPADAEDRVKMKEKP